MKYLILGLLTGILVGLAPFFKPLGGFELNPEWYGEVPQIDKIEASSNALKVKSLPPIQILDSVYILSANGLLRHKYSSDRLISISGNGKHLIEYEKAGKAIEFFNIMGDRFWKIKSFEYPYLLSPNVLPEETRFSGIDLLLLLDD